MIAALVLILLAVSCNTRGAVFTERETYAAFTALSSDMLDSLIEQPIDPAAIESSLPIGFTSYSDYVPLYDDFASDYSRAVSAIISPLITAAYPIVEDTMMDIAASHPVDLIQGDTSFTDKIRSEAFGPIRNAYLAALIEVRDELDEAFELAQTEFSMIREAYLRLLTVGGDVILPPPTPVSDVTIVTLLTNELFSRLSSAERSLKNRPIPGNDSPYNIFWRN